MAGCRVNRHLMYFLNISFWSISRTFAGSGASRTNDIWSMLICPTLLLATLKLPLHEAGNGITKVLLIFFHQCYAKMSMTFVSGRQRQEATQQTVQSVSKHLIWSSTSEESFFLFVYWRLNHKCQAWFWSKVPFVCVCGKVSVNKTRIIYMITKH